MSDAETEGYITLENDQNFRLLSYDYVVKFKKLISTAITPTKGYETDSGFDLYCTSIEQGPNNTIKYHTGIAVEMPPRIGGFIFSRSSVVKKDLMLKNAVGVIDNEYTGELILNFDDTKSYSVTQKKEVYNVGDKIGQIVFLELPKIMLVEVDELKQTDRGANGFGSTGN